MSTGERLGGQSPPESEQTGEGLPVIACFGGRCLKAHLISEKAPQPIGKYVELLFDISELHRDPPDLLAPMKVSLDPSLGVPEERRARFGGYVTLLEPRDEKTWRLEAHDMAHWADAETGGLGIRNFQAPEVLYATARDLGFLPERIHIAGWKPPRERFLVAVPVEGVEPRGELDVGSPALGLTGDPEVPKRFAGLGPEDLQAAFNETGYWAVCWVEANTLWDAEHAAIRRFERLLGRLALAARYSFAQVPDKSLRAFRRDRQLEQARLRRISAIEGMKTHRMWVRGYGRSRVTKPLDSGSLDQVGHVIGRTDERIDEAIAAWRRAIDERDSSVAVVALAEALEFYAAETKVPPLFTRTQMKAMKKAARNAAGGGLDRARLERIAWRIGQLNEPAGATLLRAAIERDEVACNDEEFDLLRRIREMRRKVLHGEARVLPGEEELRLAIAVVNRLLLHRLSRIKAHNES